MIIPLKKSTSLPLGQQTSYLCPILHSRPILHQEVCAPLLRCLVAMSAS